MNNLKVLRNEKELSTQALSKLLNINHTTINRLENGVTALNDTYIIIFANFYNVSADYILGLSKLKCTQNLLIEYSMALEKELTTYKNKNTILKKIINIDIPHKEIDKEGKEQWPKKLKNYKRYATYTI